MEEGAWLADFDDSSMGSDTDIGAGPMGSPAHSETDRESPMHEEGGGAGGGEERGNESPAMEEERGGETEGGEEEEEEEDGVTQSEAGTDTHEAAGADHCISEQGSPYTEDRPPCATERYGPTLTEFHHRAGLLNSFHIDTFVSVSYIRVNLSLLLPQS